MECELSNIQGAGKKSCEPEESDICSEREQRLQCKLDAVRHRLKIWEQRLKEWVCVFVSAGIICDDRTKVLMCVCVLGQRRVTSVIWLWLQTGRRRWCVSCCWSWKPLGIFGLRRETQMILGTTFYKMWCKSKIYFTVTDFVCSLRFTSCYDLLLSRFCAWDYKAHRISGFKINRIIRIHNQALRLHFQDKLQSFLFAMESSAISQ